MQPTYKEVAWLQLYFLRADYLQNVLGILHGRLVSLPSFIQLVIHISRDIFPCVPLIYLHYCG